MKTLSSIIKTMKFSNLFLVIISLIVILALAIWIMIFGEIGKAHAQDQPVPGEISQSKAVSATEGQGSVPAGKAPQSAWGWGLLAAALATGLSAIAAGIAVAIVGSAAMGAVAERPEVMGRSIIFVGLAEGIAIYGLIISILILGKL